MNVEFGTEAAQFPEKEYINGIFLAVRHTVPTGAVCDMPQFIYEEIQIQR